MAEDLAAVPLLDCAAGSLPPNVALAQLIATSPSREAVDTAIAAALRAYAGDRAAAARLAATLALWRETPSAWDVVRRILAEAPHHRANGHDVWAGVFDRAARVSTEAGVAVYSLGRADLLKEATASIVERLRAWGLLGPRRRVLDLGCGSGRMAEAMAAEADFVVGADVSPAMLTAARRRCAQLRNVGLVQTFGRDLAAFADDAFDLIAAVDVFPYLAAGPGGLAARHFADARRLLRPGGALLILNYTYGKADDSQQAEVAALAAQSRLRLVRFARGDFALWDGRTFHLERAD